MKINDDWTIFDNQLGVTDNQALESIFTVGNGYLGVRGSYEDDQISDQPTTHGTFINGFYETAPITYGEHAYGYPEQRQSMISLPDATHTELFLDGLPVTQQGGVITDNVRKLAMKTGTMTHAFTWQGTLSGKRLRVMYTRFVSHQRKHVFVQRLTVKPLNFKKAILTVKSTLDTASLTVNTNDDPRVSDINPTDMLQHAQPLQAQNPQIYGLQFPTINSHLTVLIGTMHSLAGDVDREHCQWQKQLLLMQPLTIDKFACYLDMREAHDQPALAMMEAELVAAQQAGFETLVGEQSDYMRRFWQASDMHIANNYRSHFELDSRFAQFQLLQGVGKDGHRGIGAKGLSSTGYDGHYFWDTEIYIMPFFTMTQPKITRALLINRYHQLPEALSHATELGYTGALFAWRTINGQESSAYFPASTAAVHLNADIMYAIQQYYFFTHDEGFMEHYGLPMLVATSRFYLSYGNWDPDRGFVINTVTGPDEYTALVNNNAYTNLMVKNQLEFLTTSFSREQVANLGVTKDEWYQFQRAAVEMYVVTDQELIGQDDSFLSKPKLDLSQISADHFPLLLHYHPLFLYQHQVLKQADLILAMALMPQRFTERQQQVNYDYYEPMTTHDSSLSRAAYAIVASRLPDQPKFDQMLQSAFTTDLSDGQGNTANGLHTASMGGTWLVILLGLAHVHVTRDWLTFEPILPPEWNAYVVPVTYRGSRMKLSVSKRGAHLSLVNGAPVPVKLNGQVVDWQAKHTFKPENRAQKTLL